VLLFEVEKEKSARNRKRFRRFATTSKRTRGAIFCFITPNAFIQTSAAPDVKELVGSLGWADGFVWGRRTSEPIFARRFQR
jgi:hypothetical protein